MFKGFHSNIAGQYIINLNSKLVIYFQYVGISNEGGYLRNKDYAANFAILHYVLFVVLSVRCISGLGWPPRQLVVAFDRLQRRATIKGEKNSIKGDEDVSSYLGRL